ncbi:MAG: hypothetical protein ABSF67_02925 [Roseiarcus sp.]|jgi:hypothetical protein
MDAVRQALAARIVELERQNTDLQEANSRLLSRARAAERERDEALAAGDDRIADLSGEINAVLNQRGREREQALQAVLDASRAGRVTGLREAAAKLEWYRPQLSGPDYGAMTDDERRVARETDNRLANLAESIRRLTCSAPEPAAIGYGDMIRKVGGAHEVEGYLAGVVTWAGVEHPVMAIPVAKGFLLHIYAWAQLARRAFGR